MLHLLAQSLPATAPAAARVVESAAPAYHVAWEKWFTLYNWQIGGRAGATLVLFVLLGIVLTRIFRRFMQAHRLRRATLWGFIAAAVYFTILAAHPYLMVDNFDVLALCIHKTFVAILLVVAIRYLDRLAILPLLTRISKAAPSRFVHQIIIAVISIFAIAGYCSWAFNIEVASFLAGSAVISIVIGLALQETLGNFFSGMVLQASVPFKAGDWIRIGTMEGRVIEMTWRTVTVLTRGNNHVLIPNSSVAKEKIVNYHTPSAATAISVSVGLEYSLPPNDAKRVLIQAAKDTPGVLTAPEPTALLAKFDDSAIVYKVRFWMDQPQMHAAIKEAVRSNIWYRLNQAGYGIPFPVRTVEHSSGEKKRAAERQGAAALRLAAIQRCALFSGLDRALQEKMAAETRDFMLAAGQAFYREGDPGDSLFILQSGTIGTSIRGGPITPAATASTPASAAQEIDAGNTAAPAIFGEVSALTGQPREATIRAQTDVHAIEVDQNHLRDLLGQNPALMAHFSQAATERQKLHEELLQKLGAAPPTDAAQSRAESTLERMKRLFIRRPR